MFFPEYALAGLWKSWGITPGAVIGHSVGEYAAACVAGGVLAGRRLEAHFRTRPSDAGVAAHGRHEGVFADEETVVKAIAPYPKEVFSIAAYNGASLLVISGLRNMLKAVIDSLERNGIKSAPLQVSPPSFSLMEPMLHDFELVAGEVSYSSPQIPIISNLRAVRRAMKSLRPAIGCATSGAGKVRCRHDNAVPARV